MVDQGGESAQLSLQEFQFRSQIAASRAGLGGRGALLLPMQQAQRLQHVWIIPIERVAGNAGAAAQFCDGSSVVRFGG